MTEDTSAGLHHQQQLEDQQRMEEDNILGLLDSHAEIDDFGYILFRSEDDLLDYVYAVVTLLTRGPKND